jgi:hypothetical protein
MSLEGACHRSMVEASSRLLSATPTLTLAPRPFQWSNRQALEMTASPMQMDGSGYGNGCFDRKEYSSHVRGVGLQRRVEWHRILQVAGQLLQNSLASPRKVLCHPQHCHVLALGENTPADNLTYIFDCNLTYAAPSGD